MNIENKNQIKRILGQLPEEIVSIVLKYSGYGDSGDFEPLECLEYNLKPIKISNTFEEQITQILERELEEKYGGWENDDGASGSFEINVRTRKITHLHNEYYQEMNQYEYNTEL